MTSLSKIESLPNTELLPDDTRDEFVGYIEDMVWNENLNESIRETAAVVLHRFFQNENRGFIRRASRGVS